MKEQHMKWNAKRSQKHKQFEKQVLGADTDQFGIAHYGKNELVVAGFEPVGSIIALCYPRLSISCIFWLKYTSIIIRII